MTDANLLHLHLPKTGGTALRHFFVDRLGDHAVTPPLQGMMLDEALLRWKQMAVISGHFMARQGDKVPADRMLVTVLRDPVDRFLSEYFYNRFDIDSLLVEANRRAGDLDAYLENASHSPPQLSLVQVEMLYPLGTDEQRRLSLDEQLAAAFETINRASMVGIQEEMEDFSCMLCAKFHWPTATPAQVNVTSRRLKCADLTAQQRRSVESLLEPEIALYAHARARFKQDRRRFIVSSDIVSSRSHCADDTSEAARPAADLAPETKRDFGDLRCEIDNVQIVGRVSGPGQAMTGEVIEIRFHVTSHETLAQVNAGIAIRDDFGSLIFGTNSLLLGDIYSLTPGKYVISFTTLNRLGPGRYSIDAALMPTLSHYDGCFHWRHGAADLHVTAYATQHFEGSVLLDVNIGIQSISHNAIWCKKLPVIEGIVARAFGNSSKPLTAFRSSLDIMSSVNVVQRDSDLLLQVRVINESSESWMPAGRYPVKLSYRWHDDKGNLLVADGVRSDLPADVAPGASVLTYLHVRTPEAPGSLYLTASLVQEHIAWFVDRDSTNGRTLPITVL